MAFVIMLPPIAPFLDPKQVLRQRMKGERRAAANARPDAGRHAAHNLLQSVNLPEGAIVALYYPIKDELDTEPLAAALTENNVAIVLPVTGERKAPLIFRSYKPGDNLIPGAYGEKIPDENASIVSPTIIVTPLLAFTRAGGRLGYGGGYYDRTLAASRKAGDVLAVGYAYGAQEVDALPLSPLDQPLDWIVTEREAIRC
jgi:5-formyltetrahydrofolate cyclo-ligase